MWYANITAVIAKSDTIQQENALFERTTAVSLSEVVAQLPALLRGLRTLVAKHCRKTAVHAKYHQTVIVEGLVYARAREYARVCVCACFECT